MAKAKKTAKNQESVLARSLVYIFTALSILFAVLAYARYA